MNLENSYTVTEYQYWNN